MSLKRKAVYTVQSKNNVRAKSGMIVNESKHLILGDTEYGFSFSVKDTLEIFGTEIDNKLNFSKHISNVCKKINNQFNVTLRF